MVGNSSRCRGLFIAVIVAGVALPLVLYALLVGRAPGVSAAQARRLVDGNAAVLVELDASLPASEDATLWPMADVMRARGVEDVPDRLRGRKMLLLCPGGIRSAQAALHLRQIGVNDVFSVRGGWQEWVSQVPGSPRNVLLHGSPAVDATVPAFQVSPAYEQWAAVGTFFGVKFVYSIISAGVVVALWHRRETDLAALRRAMLSFFIGEAFCFVNVMVFFEHSVLLEYLHSVGMVLAFGFTVYALLEGIDGRVMHYSDDGRCAAAGLCRGCIKHAPVSCGLRRLFLMLVPAVALVAALPLFAPLHAQAYNTRILGALHVYRHPVIHQLYELRYLPMVAIILLAACFLVLWLIEHHPVPWSKALFSAAIGAIGFSMFRMVLVACFADNQVWFAAWEETTELLYVGMVAGVLVVWRSGLGLGLPTKATARA
jgi:rhodanese-related sulfurtransferase